MSTFQESLDASVQSASDAARAAIASRIPSGGATGDVLVKASGSDLDVHWESVAAAVTDVDGGAL